MKKRTTLAAAVSAKESLTVLPSTEEKEESYGGSAINLRKTDWRMLRRVAEARVDRAGGGRPSVSKVIERLIDDHRAELEAELK